MTAPRALPLQSPTRVLVVSTGEVVRKRVRPALHQLAKDGVATDLEVIYLDVLEHSPFELENGNPIPCRERYRQFDGRHLPMEALARLGWCGDQSLALVCSPTRFHANYALELAGSVARVAVEKPLCRAVVDGQPLLDFTHVFPIGHQLFKQPMLQFLEQCAAGDVPLGNVQSIEFSLLEAIGIGRRQIDDVVWDTAWHGFECATAPFVAAGCRALLEVHSCDVSTYFDEPPEEQPPDCWTAARITGAISTGRRLIPLTIRVGKGISHDSQPVLHAKELVVHWRNRSQRISLSESGWAAHYRVLRELLTAPQPNLWLPLEKVFRVIAGCHEASEIAMPQPGYAFGSVPEFLSFAPRFQLA